MGSFMCFLPSNAVTSTLRALQNGKARDSVLFRRLSCNGVEAWLSMRFSTSSAKYVDPKSHHDRKNQAQVSYLSCLCSQDRDAGGYTQNVFQMCTPFRYEMVSSTHALPPSVALCSRGAARTGCSRVLWGPQAPRWRLGSGPGEGREESEVSSHFQYGCY